MFPAYFHVRSYVVLMPSVRNGNVSWHFVVNNVILTPSSFPLTYCKGSGCIPTAEQMLEIHIFPMFTVSFLFFLLCFSLQRRKQPRRVSQLPSLTFISALNPMPLNFISLLIIPYRAQCIAVGPGHSQRGAHFGSFCIHLVHLPQKKSRLVCFHGVWVPPSVPGPGNGSVLPGGGWGDWQRAIELCPLIHYWKLRAATAAHLAGVQAKAELQT